MPDRNTWRWLTVACTVFTIALIVGVGLIYLREQDGGLLTSDQLISLKAQLESSPDNETLMQEIRQADQHLRQQYFSHRIQYRWAGYLLLCSLIGTIYAGKRWLDSGVPIPDFDALEDPGRTRNNLRAVGALGAVLFGVLTWGAVSRSVTLPPADWSPEPVEFIATDTVASPFEQIWPGFRGPGNLGHAPDGDWPTTWSLTTNTNIAWSREVPREGRSSPVLTRTHIYLTGEADNAPHVMCFDRRDGQLIWDRVPVSPRGGVDEDFHADSGLAASTPTTDGTNIYAMFANGWLVGFNPLGEQLWLVDLGPIESIYGFASSLLFAAGHIIVQLDMGTEPDAALSSLMAINPADGSVSWETPRPVANTWSSPSLVPSEHGEVVVATGEPWVIGYDPASGAELWRCGGMHGEICPSPTAGNGMVFVANYPAPQMAIRLGGTGDVTETHVAWSNDLGVPDLMSPVSDGERLLHVMGSDLVCFDARTGEQLWEGEAEGYGYASPMLAGGLVYLCDSYGGTLVFDWVNGFELRGRGTLDESVQATPAFADGRIYFRTEKHLVCVGAPL